MELVDADTAVDCKGADGDNCNAPDKAAAFILGEGVAVTKMESTYDSLRVNRVGKFGSPGFKREDCAEEGAGSEQDTAFSA